MFAEIVDTVKRYGVIDSHGHIGYYKYFHMPDHDAHEMVKSMDRMGIQKVCISAMISLEADCMAGNELVAQAIRLYPDRFLGYATINPHEPDEMLPELERCYDACGMCAIKLHPELIDCAPDSKRYERVYAFAQERQTVIMNHSWGAPKNLIDLATKYDKVTFIQAHLGSSWDGYDPLPMFDAIKSLPNAYLDTAGSGFYYGAFEKTVAYCGADKLIFGTDFPFFDPAHQIGNVVCADIDPVDKQKIVRDNFLAIIEKNKR